MKKTKKSSLILVLGTAFAILFAIIGGMLLSNLEFVSTNNIQSNNIVHAGKIYDSSINSNTMVVEDYIVYEILSADSKTAQVKGFHSTMPDNTSVTIPSKVTINGDEYDVVSFDYSAFFNCSQMVSLNFTSITDMSDCSSVFYGCTNLSKVNSETAGTFDFRVVERFGWGVLGKNCILMNELILDSIESWNGALNGNVYVNKITLLSETDIPNGFASDCSELVEVVAPYLTNIGSGAFDSCSKLSRINSNVNGKYDLSQVVNLGSFRGCSALEEVYAPNITTLDLHCFSGCVNLNKLTLSDDLKYVKNSFSGYADSTNEYAEASNVLYTSESGDDRGVIYLKANNKNKFAVYGIDDTLVGESVVIDSGIYLVCWNALNSDVLKSVSMPSLKYLNTFAVGGVKKINSNVDGEFRFNNIEIWDECFSDCLTLKKLVANKIKINGGLGLFANCVNLEEIDVAEWDTSAMRTMQNMFYGCYKLKTLDLSTWDTRNVANFVNAFGNCYFDVLDISSFDFSGSKTRCEIYGFELEDDPFSINDEREEELSNIQDLDDCLGTTYYDQILSATTDEELYDILCEVDAIGYICDVESRAYDKWVNEHNGEEPETDDDWDEIDDIVTELGDELDADGEEYINSRLESTIASLKLEDGYDDYIAEKIEKIKLKSYGAKKLYVPKNLAGMTINLHGDYVIEGDESGTVYTTLIEDDTDDGVKLALLKVGAVIEEDSGDSGNSGSGASGNNNLEQTGVALDIILPCTAILTLFFAIIFVSKNKKKNNY